MKQPARLDIATDKDVQAAIDALQGKKTILIVAHRTSAVEQCDRIINLQDHSIAVIQGESHR